MQITSNVCTMYRNAKCAHIKQNIIYLYGFRNQNSCGIYPRSETMKYFLVSRKLFKWPNWQYIFFNCDFATINVFDVDNCREQKTTAQF